VPDKHDTATNRKLDWSMQRRPRNGRRLIASVGLVLLAPNSGGIAVAHRGRSLISTNTLFSF